jgi:hypothetical protein
MFKQNLSLVLLTEKFFKEHNDDEEILIKSSRLYVKCRFPEDKDNLYLVPLRTHKGVRGDIHDDLGYVNIGCKNRPEGVVDVAKTCIVPKNQKDLYEPITTPHIQRSQLLNLVKSTDEIYDKTHDFCQRYAKDRDEGRLWQDKYDFCSLKHFEDDFQKVQWQNLEREPSEEQEIEGRPNIWYDFAKGTAVNFA